MEKSYHFIGINGIGMSSIARLLLGKKKRVSGSDLSMNYMSEALEKEGAHLFKSQSSSNISASMQVVYGSDIKTDNPEYQAALQLKCLLTHRSDLLNELAHEYKSIAVAGTHGKTTTSAILAAVLVEAGLDPSFSVGGVLPQFHSNARLGQGEWFAFEADESDGTFLKYAPYGAIVTNIDNDHLNNYGSNPKTLVAAFGQFLSQVLSPQHLFWCGDDPHLVELNAPGQSYGFGTNCKWKVSHFRQKGFEIIIDIEGEGKLYKDVKVALAGKHNALNAVAVFGLCRTLGIEEKAIRHALENFQGVLRRCQKRGQKNEVLLMDDYGHHPTEIEATIKGLRQAIDERRLIAIFQPHRYSRTQDCLGQYGKIFDMADQVIVTDIYAAGEKSIPGLSAETIVHEIKAQSTVPCEYIARDRLADLMAGRVFPHDVVVSFGAGDITHFSDEMMTFLSKNSPRRLKLGLIFGGRSTEHEVSLSSAQYFCDTLRQDIYEVDYFGITREGGWITGADAKKQLEEGKRVQSIPPQVMQKLLELDVLLPILHGPYGEDGTIQGFFDILGKAYIGCDHRAAAIAMNKVFTKELVAQHGVKTALSLSCRYHEWRQNPHSILDEILIRLRFPIFVKPAHLGSSIGITKVENPSLLAQAIEKAFQVDTHVLIEEGIVPCREIEFAVLGNDEIQVFPPGEILAEGKVYDYKAKYSSSGFGTTAKAELPEELIQEGMTLARRAYKAIGACGMARVDFLLDQHQQFWFNEINPIPGFTAISLYPQMCAKNGLEGSDLMDRLIILAMHRKRRQDRCKLMSDDIGG